MRYEEMYTAVMGNLINFFTENKISTLDINFPPLVITITDIFEKELKAHEDGERLKFGDVGCPDLYAEPEDLIKKQIVEVKLLCGAMQSLKSTFKTKKPEIVSEVNEQVSKMNLFVVALEHGLLGKNRLSNEEYLITYQQIAIQAKETVEKYTGHSIFGH